MSCWQRFTSFVLLLSVLCAGCGGGGSGSGAAASKAQIANLINACASTPGASGAATGTAAGSLSGVVDAAVTAEMAAKGIPAMTVTIARKGVILYSRAYGYADLSSCRPAQPDTIFQIGSVSKEFTAAAILQLQAAGQLNIDDKVQRYLPGYAFDPRLTLRMLLNQTSGLPDYVEFSRASSWVRGVAQADVLTAIVNANTLFAPGTAYAYSNSNYFVLAAIVEAVSKTTYADYLTRHIFQPVGLSHTSVAAPSGAQTASPYSLTHPAVAGTAGLAAGLVPDPSYLFGAADLWSNGEDLAKWNAALLGGAVISPDLLTQALTPPASIPVYQTGEATSYGMGWVRGSLAGHPLAWHNGKTYDYTAYNGAFLDDGVSLSILANVDLQEDTPFFGFAQNLMQSVCSGQGTATSC